MSYLERNRDAWNRLATSGSPFARVATDEDCRDPLATLDGGGWLPKGIDGRDVLCLAAGGGWQSILYASAGANVTVVDISREMLRLDQREAARRSLSICTIESPMNDLSELREESFDIVHQPVSSNYVEDVTAVYSEVARVIRDSGLYISQHKQPTSLQISHLNDRNRYVIGLEYYRSDSLPQVSDTSYREEGTVEYLHRWEGLVGGLCRAGFLLEDLVEPFRADRRAPAGHFRHRGRFVAPYVRLKARRIPRCQLDTPAASVWTP
jgi:SAM-dependent methyltransferase